MYWKSRLYLNGKDQQQNEGHGASKEPELGARVNHALEAERAGQIVLQPVVVAVARCATQTNHSEDNQTTGPNGRCKQMCAVTH